MLFFESEDRVKELVAARRAKIAFIGLGRVGLPLAATLAGAGFTVTGIDIKEPLVKAIQSGGNPYPDEAGLGELLANVKASGKLSATTQPSRTAGCDVIIIAVPTLIENEQPDISAVQQVAKTLSTSFQKGQVVVLQSTVPPGTTEKVLGAAIARATKLEPGKDFGLGYSPERTQSPQVLKDLRTYPKIIAASDEKTALVMAEIFKTFAPDVIRMKSIAAAELEKVVENTYRDVNIAFANELALLCNVYGLDVTELISAANSQPYSRILQPGLVGGHCIPMDPYYVIEDAKKRGFTPHLIQTARRVNEALFEEILDMLDGGVRKVTLLGLAFKPDVRSFETSHSLKLVKLLTARGYEVVVHDPYLEGGETFGLNVEPDVYQAAIGSDCLILATAHSQYRELDFARLEDVMNRPVLIDTRNFFDPEKVKEAGFKYRGLGR